jgi:hypothetical protein
VSKAESRIIGYGIAGSLAVHLLALMVFACWVAFAPAPKVTPHDQAPPVEVVLPENIELVTPPPTPVPEPPKPKPKPQRFIDTAENEPDTKAPDRADFISDRDTKAMSKIAPPKDGDQPLPTTQGVKVSTLDLSNREYKPGEIKDERSMPMPPATPPVLVPPKKAPAPPTPEPPPPQKMAKKEDSPGEKMMKELDEALQKDSKEAVPTEVRKAKPLEKAPDMKLPEEPLTPPQAIPLPPPVPPSPKPGKNEFVPQKRTSEVKGRISNIGQQDSADAVATAEGRYIAQVKAAINQRWLYHTMHQADFVQPCDIVVQMYITKEGKAKDVRILSSNGNAVVTDFTLGSVLEAKIPPIPEDLREQMTSDLFEMPMEFLIY